MYNVKKEANCVVYTVKETGKAKMNRANMRSAFAL